MLVLITTGKDYLVSVFDENPFLNSARFGFLPQNCQPSIRECTILKCAQCTPSNEHQERADLATTGGHGAI